MLSEISQSEKDKYGMISNENNTELTSKIEIGLYRESRLTGRGKQGRRWRDLAKRKKDLWTWTAVW